MKKYLRWDEVVKIRKGLYCYKGYMIESDKSIWANPYDTRATTGTGNWYIYHANFPRTLEVRQSLKDGREVVDYYVENDLLSFKLGEE